MRRKGFRGGDLPDTVGVAAEGQCHPFDLAGRRAESSRATATGIGELCRSRSATLLTAMRSASPIAEPTTIMVALYCSAASMRPLAADRLESWRSEPPRR